MPNAPKQPADPPPDGSKLNQNPPGQGVHGTAHGQGDHDATGSPTDDRHDTETAPQRIEQDRS